jgi:hypothetical protein
MFRIPDDGRSPKKTAILICLTGNHKDEGKGGGKEEEEKGKEETFM